VANVADIGPVTGQVEPPARRSIRGLVAQTEVDFRLFGMHSERLKRAKTEGDLPKDADPAALARFVATVTQGMAVQAAGGASHVELRRVAETALRAFPD